MISIEQLKERKKELGITFDELSEKSGIPKTTLTNILCGKTLTPRIDTMQAIENALGLSAPQEQEKTPVFQRKTEIQAYFDELTLFEQSEVIGYIKRMLYNKGIDAQRIKDRFCS